MASAGPTAGGHAGLCEVGAFYRDARVRRISQLSIMDSNGINADNSSSYGYVYGMHEAAFEDDTFECWAAGLYSATFTPSTNPVFTISVGQPISINDPSISGFAGAFKGVLSVNGAHLSVRDGRMADIDSAAGIRSVFGSQAPPWFLWETLPLSFHYTTFRDAAPGDGLIQLRVDEAGLTRLTGAMQPTNGAPQDTVVDDVIVGSIGDIPRNQGARIRLMARRITGQAVWNYIIPEVSNRLTGFLFAQLWVEGGGGAIDAAQDIANASPAHIDKMFERVAAVQNEDNPKLVVHLVIGGNDWFRGDPASSVLDAFESIRLACESAWLNAGNTPENLVYLIVGYHPRAGDPNYGYRNELRDYALATERVAFYDPAAEFTVQDMIDNGYSDNAVTGNDPHMSDAGYRAFALRQFQVIESAASAGIADLNSDGVVNTADLGILISSFGTPGPDGDLNGDDIVDTADLGALIAAFAQESCASGG